MTPNKQPARANTRPSISEQLQKASHKLDLLIRDAEMIQSQRDYDAVEERVQAIAASMIAAVRGSQARVAPSAPPLSQSTQGDRSCAWY